MFKWKTWHRGMLLLINIKEHLRLIRILSHPQTKRLIIKHPELTYKYLRDYLSFDLSTGDCLAILIEHYSCLQNNFGTDFLDVVYHSPVRLWQQCLDGTSFEITLEFPHTIDFEGDLCLLFKKNQVCIYRIIFVIANGRAFERPEDNVIFISSVQGMNDFEEVKQATKVCHDIQPAQLLMAAMNGVGMALGFRTIVGIGNTNQISQGEQLHFSYDKFFEKYGFLIPGKNFYAIQLPYVEKPLDSIHIRHRKRTQKKRDFKHEIRDQVALAVERYIVRKPVN